MGVFVLFLCFHSGVAVVLPLLLNRVCRSTADLPGRVIQCCWGSCGVQEPQWLIRQHSFFWRSLSLLITVIFFVNKLFSTLAATSCFFSLLNTLLYFYIIPWRNIFGGSPSWVVNQPFLSFLCFQSNPGRGERSLSEVGVSGPRLLMVAFHVTSSPACSRRYTLYNFW